MNWSVCPLQFRYVSVCWLLERRVVNNTTRWSKAFVINSIFIWQLFYFRISTSTHFHFTAPTHAWVMGDKFSRLCDQYYSVFSSRHFERGECAGCLAHIGTCSTYYYHICGIYGNDTYIICMMICLLLGLFDADLLILRTNVFHIVWN